MEKKDMLTFKDIAKCGLGTKFLVEDGCYSSTLQMKNIFEFELTGISSDYRYIKFDNIWIDTENPPAWKILENLSTNGRLL